MLSHTSTRRQLLKTTAGVGLTSSLLAGCQGSNGTGGADGWKWTIGGGADQSVSYSWMNRIAQMFAQESESIELSPQTTTGFLDIYQRVSDGRLDMGVSGHNGYWAAKQGKDPFSEPQETLGLPATPTIHLSGFWIATRADSDIETVEDLEGTRYSYYDRGAAANPLNQRALELAGVLDSMNTVYSTLGDLRSAVLENRVDAWFMLIIDGWVHPGPMVDIGDSVGIKSVKFTSDVQEKMQSDFKKAWAYDEWETADFNNLKVQSNSVQSFATPSSIFANPGLDKDGVYEFTKTMLENQETLSEMHPAWKTFGFGPSGEGAPHDERFGFKGIHPDVEFHPGAVKYFDENDISYPRA